MIDRVKNIVFTILNKEKRGPITPAQFIDSCTKNQNKIFSDYFDSTFMREKNREAKGMANDSVKLYEQRLSIFYVDTELTESGGLFSLPDDCYFVDRRGVSIKDDSGEFIDVDIMTMPHFRREESSSIFPVGVITNKSIKVKPEATETVHVDYYRKPKDPNWTYNNDSGVPFFDPSNGSFQDLEIHPSEESELIMGVLSDFGIIKREGDISQLINSIKQADTNDRSRLL